ncbi:hypothetical protein [Bizionia arctica]|uniref:Outer membrane protein beta-barrel domain-containing protein n=1 Tax=Bizionia arctica TaxID=1495645 RepID=A0A917LTJ8_9FLAO|nr:hypothetical protein [Bizionia arctica]GGG56588.1 hypothetical protein GCM10010976_29300 [Bizionia arctica]
MPTLTFAQDTKLDSTDYGNQTPFRKGRWLTGLSGAIGSGSFENTKTDNKSISNWYRFEIATGTFLIDRLNLGLSVNMERSNEENENEENTSETFFVGPKGTYYLSPSSIGSVFFSLSPGYALYRETLGGLEDEIYVENINKGGGFGFLSTFGFSYVIQDRIVFDLGLNYNVYWLNLNQGTSVNQNSNNVTYELSNISFSFGFKILIDSKPL